MVPVRGPFFKISLLLHAVFLKETWLLNDVFKPNPKHVIQDKKYDYGAEIPFEVHLNIPLFGDKTSRSQVLRHLGD